jgi:hypothetical protein
MNKWLLSILLFIAFGFNGYAIENYKVGDSLTVFINSGLKLREKPSAKSLAIATIPIGKKVFIKKQLLREYKHQDSLASIRLIKGYWVKVDYNGQAGYVFDGYLSSLPYPVIFKQEFYRKNNYSTESAYLFTHFKKVSNAFNTTLIPKEYGNNYFPNNTSSPYNKYKDFSLKFSDSITYTRNVHLEIGETNKMEFKHHSLDEVLLLAKAIVDTYDDEYTTNKFVYNKQSKMYMMGAVYDAGCSVSIYEKGGVVYWIQYCGC